MSDTRDLLHQLRIERTLPPLAEAPRKSRATGYITTAVLLAFIAAGFLSTGADSQGILIEVATVSAASDASATDNAVLNASGYVVARRQATVSAKITARVTEVFIDEGQHVEANEVIARMDDTNVRAALTRDIAQVHHAGATLHAAETALRSEEPLFARVRQQVERGVGTQQDLDTAMARYEAARAAVEVARQAVFVAEANRDIAQRNVDDTVVRAPFAGIVTVKAAQPGEMVSPVSAGGGFTRTGIGTIVDMASLEVDVDVSESFINRVVAGNRVSVRLSAYPDWAIAGRVITVVPTADRAKATVKVRIALDENDQRMLPDMGARVTFLHDATASAPSTRSNGVVIPETAVIVNGTRGTVFIVQNDTVQQRELELGAQTASGWSVPEGLSAGTRLAASSLDQLHDGATIRIAPTP